MSGYFDTMFSAIAGSSFLGKDKPGMFGPPPVVTAMAGAMPDQASRDVFGTHGMLDFGNKLPGEPNRPSTVSPYRTKPDVMPQAPQQAIGPQLSTPMGMPNPTSTEPGPDQAAPFQLPAPGGPLAGAATLNPIQDPGLNYAPAGGSLALAPLTPESVSGVQNPSSIVPGSDQPQAQASSDPTFTDRLKKMALDPATYKKIMEFVNYQMALRRAKQQRSAQILPR